MDIILPCACGVDVHEKMIEACILKLENSKISVLRQQFSTFPEHLKSFTDWLYENDCYHIAMESTGVYWKPVYETIEANSVYYENIVVANAHHIKNVPGRKSDVKDAEWIGKLMILGLISGSYVPNSTIRSLREIARTYKKMIGEKNRYKNRIEKFLQAHGFKLSSVLSDIFCVTGLNILNQLALRGSLTYEDISSCMRGNLKSSAQEIYSAVNNKLTASDCKVLQLLLNKLKQAEKDIEYTVELMSEISQDYSRQLEVLDSIPGIDKVSALLILAEIGNAPFESFETPEKLCSWAGLAPRNDESAGKVNCAKILPGNQYLKPILVQVAWVAVKCRNTPFHQWFWSHQRKMGQKKAIIAVARKILKLIFKLLKDDVLYDNDVALSNLKY
ncbi:MAG: IS110 family transposase [Clostridia bacterium]|nr:IS110 family transposase [Clostridia bacterium]